MITFLQPAQLQSNFSVSPSPLNAPSPLPNSSSPIENGITLPLDRDLFTQPFRTTAEAREDGFEVLAGPYAVCHRWMARRVLDDLARDPEIEICLVKRVRGAEIWIKPSRRQQAAMRKEIPTLSCHGAQRPTLTYQPPITAKK